MASGKNDAQKFEKNKPTGVKRPCFLLGNHHERY